MDVEIINPYQLAGYLFGIFVLLLCADGIKAARNDAGEWDKLKGRYMVMFLVNKASYAMIHIGFYMALYALFMWILDNQYRTLVLTPPSSQNLAVLGLFKVQVNELSWNTLYNVYGVNYHLGSIMYGVVTVLFYELSKSVVDWGKVLYQKRELVLERIFPQGEGD